MPKIIMGDKEKEVKEGDSIIDACDELGVPFACKEGVCGSCRIDILEGENNLSNLTENETAVGLDKKTRFACQCKIKKGDVKINF